MKRASKAALIFSGTAFVAGAAVGIAPVLEQFARRWEERNDVAEASMLAPDFSSPTFGGAPRNMTPVAIRNPENSPGIASPTGPTVAMTMPEAPSPHSIRFTATNLNSLPDGKNFEPMAINNRGEIVGNYRTVQPIEYTIRAMDGRRMPAKYRATAHPAVFRQGKFENLPAAPDCAWTFATGINDNGIVVGAARPLRDLVPLRVPSNDLPLVRVLRWEKGALQDLSEDFYRVPEMQQDARRGRFNVFVGDPVFINNNGTIFLGVGSLYRWQQGVVSRFPMGMVRQVSEQGVMVGLVPTPNRAAAITEASTPPGMVPPGSVGIQPGLINTETGQTTALGRFSDLPCAINDTGVVILSGNRAGNLSQISTWKNGKAEKVATIPPTINCSINNEGIVVFGDGVRDWPRNRRGMSLQAGPFLWDGKHCYNLQSLVQNLKGDWVFSQIVGINDRNEVLVYAYEVGRPERHAFLLTPVRG